MYIDLEQLRAALALRDLTDASQGAHAMQAMCDALVGALGTAWSAPVRVVRGSPVVTARDNYDRLYYPPDGSLAMRATRAGSDRACCCAVRPRRRFHRRSMRWPPTRRGAMSSWRAPAWCIAASASTVTTSASRTRSTCGGSGAVAARSAMTICAR